MIKLKEYAAQAGVSYEMIRQQIHTYKKQLGEHLIYQKGSYYLDDEGVAILDGIRQKTSPTAKIRAQKKKIQQLQKEIGYLKRERKNIDLSTYLPFLKHWGYDETSYLTKTWNRCISVSITDRGKYGKIHTLHLAKVDDFSKCPFQGRYKIVTDVNGGKWYCVVRERDKEGKANEQTKNAGRVGPGTRCN